MPEFGSAADKVLELGSGLPYTDFVDFTSGLVRSVTQVLHDSNREQLLEYVKLVDAVAGTLSEFETKTFGDLDAAARDYLNNTILPTYGNDPDSRALDATEVNNDDPVTLVTDPGKRATLTAIFDGIKLPVNGVDKTFDEHVDTATNKIGSKALVRFAKAELQRTAKQSYGELKALVQMGIMRLFPEYAVIRTTLLFDAKSNDSASTSTSETETEYQNRSLNWGVNGSANYRQSKVSKFVRQSFGAAISGGISSARTNTKFRVKTVDTKSSSSVDANLQITGFVEVKLKTDLFPQFPQETTPAIPA